MYPTRTFTLIFTHTHACTLTQFIRHVKNAISLVRIIQKVINAGDVLSRIPNICLGTYTLELDSEKRRQKGSAKKTDEAGGLTCDTLIGVKGEPAADYKPLFVELHKVYKSRKEKSKRKAKKKKPGKCGDAVNIDEEMPDLMQFFPMSPKMKGDLETDKVDSLAADSKVCMYRLYDSNGDRLAEGQVGPGETTTVMGTDKGATGKTLENSVYYVEGTEHCKQITVGDEDSTCKQHYEDNFVIREGQF
jgi:hypothetical protein